MRSVELFAGAGGLALGCELAGFRPAAVVEWNAWACGTIERNRAAGHPLVADWAVTRGDVRAHDWGAVGGGIDLVSGGPPCQPFSAGGKARGSDDQRDMFPAAAEAIRVLRPRAFLIENVRGLTRPKFAEYFQHILLRLQHPDHPAAEGEEWQDHHRRLQAVATAAEDDDLRYIALPNLVNAADYGVPQQRHRVLIVGFRSDVPAEWSLPAATHSLAQLVHDQWATGIYWDRHRVASKHRPPRPRGTDRLIRLAEAERLQPWRTVRDALQGLPEPGAGGSRRFLNHVRQEGARSYHGHTGSPLDLPAKALKAGDHGVPGGENMLRRPDGSVRYFTVRESARLQTFPDRYELHGAWTEAMRQLGNAVPVLLAQTVAGSIREHLELAGVRERAAAHGRRTA